MLRVALVTNELPPYRIPFFQALHDMPEVALQVLLCSRREPNRYWELPELRFNHLFLRERIITMRGRYIHNNPEVVPALYRFSPDVIVTGGFNPTHLYAFGYAAARAIPHVAMTDGTDHSERKLSRLHQLVRRTVYGHSAAFVSASAGGQRLHESYGVNSECCFRSCLCIDNTTFSPPLDAPEKRYDFLFCGRFEAVKNPLFALDVAEATAKLLGRKVAILFVGTGSQENELRAAADQCAAFVRTEFRGFVSHDALPALYHSARLFLFPSCWDPWGVVANEACAAGLPVLVTPEAGCAGELVVDECNGFVCRLDAQQWATQSARLLAETDLWKRFSEHGQALVENYTYTHAATGLVSACQFAASTGRAANRRSAPR